MAVFVTAVPAFAQSDLVDLYAFLDFLPLEDGFVPEDVTFSSDGMRMFILDSAGHRVEEYRLNTAYDLTGATSMGFQRLPSVVINGVAEDSAQDIEFSTNGRILFFLGAQHNQIFAFSLPSPYDIAGAAFRERLELRTFHPDVPSEPITTISPTGMSFAADGRMIFVVGTDRNGSLNYLEIPLNRSFNLGRASINSEGNLAFSNMEDIELLDSNDEIFIINNNMIHGFDDSPNVNGTASFASLNVRLQDPMPTGIDISPDASKMFITGAQNNRVYEYELDRPPTIAVTSTMSVNEGDNLEDFGRFFEATDPDGDPITYGFINFRNGITVTTNGLLRGTLPYDVVGCTADTVIPISVFASDDGFDDDPTDSASLVYELRVTSSPNPENSPTRADRSFLVIPANQRTIDMSLYDTDDDDVILTYHDAAVSPDGIISTASIDEDGILSITQNPGGISSELTYGVCNGEDYIPLSITLRAADATPRQPEFITIPDAVTIPEGTVIGPELINFVASDPNGDDTLSYRLVDAPDWLEIEPSVDLPGVGRLLGTVPYDVVGCDGGSTSLTFDVQISDDGFADPANTISVQYTMTATSLNLQGNSDPTLTTILAHKGTSIIDLNEFAFDRDGDSLTYSNPNTVFLVVNSLSPDGMMNVTIPHNPGNSGTLNISMCDGTRIVTRTTTVSVPVYEFVDSRDTPSAVDEISGIYFSNDGRQLFQVDSDLDNAYEIILEQSFDISAPSTENEVFLESAPDAIDVMFDGDGNNMFVVESEGDIYQYALSKPFFLDDGTGTPVITDISSHFEANPDLGILNIQGVDFSANGDKMYAVTTTGTDFNDTIYEFTLDRNFDISSISSTQFRNISDRVGLARDIRISDDDAKMFIVAGVGDLRRPSHIVEYTFGSGLDLSTAESSGIYNIANQREDPVSIEFSAHGYKMFVAEADNDNINEYNLGLPFTMLSDTDIILPVDEEFAGIFRKSSLPITVNFSRPMTGFTVDDIVLTGAVNRNNPQASNFTGSGASYSFNVERGASDGGVTILIGRGVATDEFGHPNEISRLSNVFIDTPPVPFINSTIPSPTNLLTIPYTVEFSDPVGGFNATGIEVTGSADGVVENFVKIDNDSYTFDVSHNSVEGVVSVFIRAGVADELTGRPSKNLDSNRLNHTIDRIAPMPILTSTSQEDTNSRTIPFTVDFGEPVTGFNHTGIAVTGPAGVDENSFEAESDSVYNFDVVATADGQVSVQIPEGVAQDAAENENVASVEVARTVDTVRPTVGISTITISPTNLASISYTVTFEEKINDFDARDIDASIPGSTPTVNGPTLTVGNTQIYMITHNADEGILTVLIPENVATDNAGNSNIASESLAITIDRIAPTVTGASISDTDTIILEISEPVSGGAATDFVISGVNSGPAVDSIDVTGNTITLDLNSLITDADTPLISYTGTAGSIEDPAENPLAVFTGRSVTNNLDTTAPAPVLSNEIDSPTNLAIVPYTVDFGEEVRDFDRDGIDASIDGASLTASNPVTNDNITYTFTIAHGASEGELRVSIRAGAATDMDSNTSTASNTISRMIDRIPPTVTAASASDTDTIVLTISEPLDESGGAASDFTISGVALNPAVASIDITGNTITLELNDLITDADNPTVSYTETTGIEDLAENRLANFAGQTVANDLDTTGPMPALTITSEPGATHTNSLVVSYRVEFDMDVDGFIEEDIMVEGSANNDNPETSNFVTVDDATYTFDVERDNSDGNVIVFIPANRAIDGSGNQNVASNRLEITFDTILPTATLASTESGDTRLRTIPVNVTFSERVDDFDIGDIIIVGSATANAPVTNDNILYMFDIVVVDDVDVTVSIREDAARDMAGNRNVESETVTFMVDTERPIAELSSIVVSPTNLEVISYTVDFGEQVNDFVAIDFGIPASSSGLLATDPVSADNIIYTFNISHGADEGIISVLIPENATTDNAGNNNTASELLAITIDRIAPTVTGASVSDTDTIILDISESLSESESVGVPSDFTISGVATNPSVSSIDITGSTITLNLDDSITDADTPLISYTGTAGSIEDLATNPLAAFTDHTVENEIDTTGPVPTLTITSEPGFTHTNSSEVSYMVEFDMDVDGFTDDDIMVEGLANNGNPETSNFFTVNDATYTFDVERGDSDGNVIVSIPENRATDRAGNQNVASDRLEIIFDTAPPTATLASTESGDTRLRTIPVNVTFSERVDDFDADDIIIEGTATANTPTTDDNILYMFDVIATADGDVTVSIREDAARDVTGNRNAESETLAFAVDTVRARAVLSTEIISPTNLEVISYTVDFGEQVNGFVAADIDASIDDNDLTATNPVSDDGIIYTFNIAHGVDEGILEVSIPENVATDDAGNNNTASESLAITIDRIAPTVVSASVSDTDTIILDISELLSESESVGVTSDFTISGVATNPSVSSIVITGSTITLNLNSLITDADNPVISYTGAAGSIEDLATNPLAAFTDRAVDNEIDTTGPVPTLTITSEPGATHTNSSEVSYMVEFDMDVTRFNATGIDVSGSADGGNPEVSVFAGSGNTYTFDVERGNSDGNVMVFIPAGRAIDASENQNVASDRLEIIFDTAPPTATLASTESGDTRLRTIPVNVTFSERVDDFDADDIIIVGVATANTPTTDDNILYMFDVIATADGDVTVSIREDAARDAAGNRNAESESVAFAVDTVRPFVGISTSTTSPTNLESISYIVEFREEINDFVAGDIIASIDGSTPTVTGPVLVIGNTQTYVVAHNSNEGILEVSIPENIATDNAGNNNTASNELVHTVDRIAPTVVSASVSDTDTIILDISELLSESESAGVPSDFTISGVATNPSVSSIDITGSIITLNLDDSITDADLPRVSYTGTAGSIEDLATNRLAAFTSRAVDNEIDTTRPTATLRTESPLLTNSPTITFTVQFNESVDGFDDTSNISITGTSGATAGAPTFTDPRYTFDVTRGSTDGTVIVSVSAGAARDNDDNLSEESNEITVTIDTIPPTVTGASVSDTDTIILDISEPVSDDSATPSDFGITGVTSAPEVTSIDVAGSTITLDLNRLITDADTPLVSYTRITGGINDTATNRLADFAGRTVTNNIDTTRPAITSFGTESPDPTNSQTITYRVEFSESVTRFNATGIDVTGTSGGTANEPTGAGRNYEFTVNRGSSDGTVTVTILEGAARDEDMNLSFASSPVEVTVDATPPTVTGAEVINPNIIRLDLSEPVSDSDAVASDFTIAGAASNPVVSSIAVSGSSIELSLAPSLTDADNPTVSYTRTVGGIEDAATNRLANFAGFTVTNDIDTTAPAPTLSTDIDSPTNLAVIPYMVNFGEEVRTFDRNGIDASIDGASLTASEPASNDGVTYTFTVTHNVNEGELRVSIRAGAATDMDSNTSTASNTISRMIDRIAPTVTGASVSDTDTIILDISELLSESESVGVPSDFTIIGVASTPAVDSIDITGSTITLDLNDLITDADLPLISYTGTAGSIEDLAENPLAAFTDRTVENEIDTTGPVPTLTITSEPGTATHTNSPEVSYMVEFDMDVTGFIDGDIMVEGSADNGNPEVSNFVIVSGSVYTFDVERGDSDGNVLVFIPAGRAIDASDNQNVASDRLEIIFDTISPTLELASAESGDTRLRTIPFNATFSERVDDFDAVDIIIEGSATAGTPTTDDNILYMFDIVATADGDVTVSIRENAAQDMADNGNAESETIALTVDTVRPFVGISTSTTSPTNLESISYTVEFREEINGFVAGDIIASIDGSTPTVTGPVLVIGNTQTYVVAHNSNEGILEVSIPENIATDNAGNNNTASELHTITVDRIAPTVVSASVSDTDTITLEISESVSGGMAFDFAISGVNSAPEVDSIAVSGSTITLNLDDSITDADLPLLSYTGTTGSIEDLAENPLANFASQIVRNDLDTTRPTVTTFTTTSSDPTNSQTITYRVEFSESVTGFSAAGISVGGTSGGTANEPTGAGRNYEFTVERGSSDGTVTVTILEGAARDADDNLSFASSSVEVTIDATPPTVTGASVSDTDTIILDISEPVSDDSATPSDFGITGVTSAPEVTSIDVAGSTITLDLNRLITDADTPLVSYTRTTGGIEDPATNRLANFAGFTVTNDIDTTRPSVTTFTTTSSNPTNSQTIMYEVQFSESVTGFDATGIDVSGTSGGTAAEPTGAGTNYEFVVTRGASDGTVTVTILEGAARDADDNLSFASSPVEITVDATPPTVTGAEVLNPNIIRLDLSEQISDSDAVASDFTIAGAASNPVVSSLSASGSTVELSLTPSLTDADIPTVSYTRTAGGIEDPATNRLANFVGRTVTNDIDTTAPAPTLSTDIDSPTNLAVIPYMVEFTEEVSGFDRNGIDASIDGATLTASEPVTNDNITYTFTVTHNVNEGELRVSIRAGAATDMDSNTSTASNTISHMIDRIAPTVVSASVSDTDTIILNVSELLSESESAGVTSDFTISGVATNPSVSSIVITGSTITLDLNDLITDADLPLISYTGTAGSIEDLAENPLAAFTDRAVENEIDTTGPVPTLTITSDPGATHTNSPEVSYRVEFDMDVDGFDIDDIEVSGSADGGNPEVTTFVTVSDSVYTFEVERDSSDGNVIVFIPEDRATDRAGNQNVASDRLEIIFDTISPTLTLASAESGDTRLRIIPFNATFSERVDDFDAADIIIEGSATANTPTTSDDIFYEFDLVATADGDVSVSIRENAARDMADNGNAESETIALRVDTERPTVEITSLTVDDLPTNLESISYTVAFNEQVNDFVAGDISASIDGSPLTASSPVPGADNTYTFDVTHGTNEGELVVSIPENVATDNAGNNNTASNELVHTVDRIAPTVVSASVSDTDTITLEISESVSGGAAFDFTISGVISGPAVDSIAISGSTITLNLDDSITDADLPLLSYTGTTGSIEDPALNPLAAFTNRAVDNEIDTTRPAITSFGTESPDPTNSQTIMYRVEFSESVTRFNATGIDVTGTSGGTANEPTGAGRNYEFTVNRGSSDGMVTVTILEGAARDADDNLSFASTPVEVTVDATPPTVTGAEVLNPNIIRLDLSEPVSDNGATASDFTIAGAASNPVVSSIAVSGSSIELSLAPSLTDADNPTVSYTRTVGGIEDAATNRLANFVNQAVTNNLDTTRPTVTSFTTTSSNPTNSQTIMYEVQFSESVTGFSAAGISVGGTSGGTAAEPTGAGRDYEFTLTRGASDGTVTVTILEGAARDADDNLSFASSPVEVTVDATPPTVTGADVVNPNIIRLDISEPVSDDNAVASNFAISGAASNPAVSSIAVSGSSIELSLSQPLTDSDSPTVSYTRTSGEIEDAATNRLADFVGRTVTNNIDTTAPVPTLSTDIDSPTNLAVMPYMVVFTEEVSGFDRGDIDASIDGASLTASRPASDDNITYTFTIAHGASEGELRVSIRAGAATDMDSNTSTASNTISHMIDRIAPIVTSATASDTDTIILDISELLSESESVGVASDFTISGVASTPAVSSINIAGSTITLNLDDSITDADNPTVSYTGTVDIEDAAENRLANFAGQTVENNLDTTGPVPTLTITSAPGSTHTNSLTVSYMVEFDMDVDGFIEGDIMVEGSANNGNPDTSNFVIVSGSVYTFDVERDGSDGNVIVSIPEDRATDMAGNQNIASDRLEIIFDTISPTATLASTESGDTKLRTIPFTVRFGEVVSGFARNDIIIEGAATADTPTTSDNILYEFDLVATSDGPVTVSIRENAVLDMADNGNAASGMITLTVDTGRVRADLSTDIISPTNLATIPYTVDFGEPVTGFTAADIDASVDGTPVTASVPVAGADDTYTFGVTHNVLEGVVTVSIMAGAVMDGAENTNDASNSITLTVERIAPTVTVASVSDTNTIVLNISESVSGGMASDFTVTGVASIPSVSSIGIVGNTITLDLNGLITDADNPIISYIETDGIEDLAENRLAAFTNKIVANNLDTTGPVPAITSTTNSPTNSPEIQYTVDFVERVDGFDEGDISASIDGVQLRASRPASDDGIIYTFMITHGATEGVVTVSIPANSVTDGDGNVNTVSNVITHVVDRVGPIPSVSTETSSPTNLATIQYNVTFNMPVTGFTVGDITVTGSADIDVASFVAVNSTHYTFEVARSSDGVARASVPAGSAIDGADNGNVASNVATIVFDTTAPVARSGALLNNGNIRLAMSERVFDNGTAASDFAVSGAASSPQVTSISVFRSAIELGLDAPITDDDVLTVSYNRTSGNIHDAATNSLGNFTGIEIGIEDDGVDNTKWRTKATFGISYVHGEKLVDCGYSMDKICRDVLDYHVDYQRQSITTNSTHDYTLKTYAQNGLRSLGIAFGVPSIGSPLSSAEAQIRVDLARDYDVPSTYLIENIEYINENRVIGQNATFEISRVKCLPTDERHDCVLLNINDVLFREQLYHEPFVISAMDSNRYATVHFMNDGILVYGDSLNEAPVHDLTTKLAHQRDLAQLTLTRTDKLSDIWTDQHGHTWTKNSFGTWSYVEIPKITVRPSCTDIDDRVCEAFGKKLDWHTTNMEDMRDSLYGDIYTIPEFDSLTEVITLHDVDGDSRAAFLAESAYYLLD